MAREKTRQQLKRAYLSYWKESENIGTPVGDRLSWAAWLNKQKITLPPREKKTKMRNLYLRARTAKALREYKNRMKK